MSFINYMAREINCKIVYYGPGLCGKTTNLQYIYERTNPEAKGKMISLATETERTLFFDFLPLSLGEIRGFKTRFHLYTVPGQVFYDASRKLILKGVDGVIFVADSQIERLEANQESVDNLKTNPTAKGKMISLATETERTLFFDFLPIALGEIRGFKTRFHLYTVPGQVFYDASRKLILKGVDGVVFVADSQEERREANIESLDNLRTNLEEQGFVLEKLPFVMQYNKRDLPSASPVSGSITSMNRCPSLSMHSATRSVRKRGWMAGSMVNRPSSARSAPASRRPSACRTRRRRCARRPRSRARWSG